MHECKYKCTLVPSPCPSLPCPAYQVRISSCTTVEAIGHHHSQSHDIPQSAVFLQTIRLSFKPAVASRGRNITQLAGRNNITSPSIMRVPEVVKQVLKRISGSELNHEVPVTLVDAEDGCDVSEAAPGPKYGPKPGKLGIIFYYLSLVLCMIGVLTILRCLQLEVRLSS